MTLRATFDRPEPLTEAAVQAQAIPLLQTTLFAEAMSRAGHGCWSVPLHHEGREIGRAVVTERRLPLLPRMRAVLRGPAWFDEPDRAARAAGYGQLAGMGVRLVEPEAACPGLAPAGFVQVMTPGHIAQLDLWPGEAPLSRATAKWRASRRLAEAANITICHRPFHGPEADWLIAAEAEMRRARRYRSTGAVIAAALVQTQPGALRLVTAREKGAPIAAMLFACHGASGTYLLGATTPRGRAVCAHHLCLATGAGWLADHGARQCDLGAVDTQSNPGLARFKLGSGARLVELGGSWLRLPRLGR